METIKILETLLRQQGITQFYPLEKPAGCSIDIQLYGYVKDDLFHICDANLQKYSRDVFGLPSQEALLVCLNNGHYIFSNEVSDSCFIISSENKLLETNPKGYFYINRECFLVTDKLIEFDERFCGIVFDVKQFYENIQNQIWHDWEVYKGTTAIKDITFPEIILGSHPYIKGLLHTELHYLFNIGKSFYFYNTDTNSVETINNNYWIEQQRNNLPTDFVWYSMNGGVVVNLEEFPNNTDLDTEAIDITINQSVSRLEVINEFGESDSFFGGQRNYIQSNSDFLVIKIGSECYKQFVIVIDSYCKVCFSKLYEESEVNFYNNLLSVRNFKEKKFNLMDCNGNKLEKLVCDDYYQRYSSLYFHNASYSAGINISNHIVFDHNDKIQYMESRKSYRNKGLIDDNDFHSSFHGVIDLADGKTLVPFNFSGCIISREKEPFSEEDSPETKIVSIVWIDHFYNSKKSYYGLFLNEELIIPIAYDEISFIHYIFYENRYDYFEKNTKFMYIKKDGLYGVLDIWGREILPIEAVKVECLTKDGDSNYILAFDQFNNIKVIFKNRILSDYNYYKTEVINPKEIGLESNECKQIVKLYSDRGITFVYEGVIIAEFDDENVSVHGCLLKFGDETNQNFVFLEEWEDCKVIYDSHGNKIIQIEGYNSISINRSYIEVDGEIYGNEKTPIAYTNYSQLRNSVKNEYYELRVYYIADEEQEEYLLFASDYWGECKIIHAPANSSGLSEKIFNWKYDFDNDEFINCSDGGWFEPDEPDYREMERDTFYALGGDDYDSFRDNGGSIDDMMDGMGY